MIPGGKPLDATDIFDDVKVFQAFKDEYIGDISPLEELRLKWLELAKADPELEARTERYPTAFRWQSMADRGASFICRRVPTLTKTDDGSEPTWSLTPGRFGLKTDDKVERASLQSTARSRRVQLLRVVVHGSEHRHAALRDLNGPRRSSSVACSCRWMPQPLRSCAGWKLKSAPTSLC